MMIVSNSYKIVPLNELSSSMKKLDIISEAKTDLLSHFTGKRMLNQHLVSEWWSLKTKKPIWFTYYGYDLFLKTSNEPHKYVYLKPKNNNLKTITSPFLIHTTLIWFSKAA